MPAGDEHHALQGPSHRASGIVPLSGCLWPKPRRGSCAFFGDPPTGTIPVKVGEETVSLEDHNEMGCTFDGSEFWLHEGCG